MSIVFKERLELEQSKSQLYCNICPQGIIEGIMVEKIMLSKHPIHFLSHFHAKLVELMNLESSLG